MKDLSDGVRIQRARNTAGTIYQKVIWNFTSQEGWSWVFDSGTGFTLESVTIDDTVYPGGNTRDASAGGGNDQRRLFTSPWGGTAPTGHQYIRGFSYGSGVSDGSNNSTNFLFEINNENSAIPYTEVYVRE